MLTSERYVAYYNVCQQTGDCNSLLAARTIAPPMYTSGLCFRGFHMSARDNQVDFWNVTIPNGVNDFYRGRLPEFSELISWFMGVVSEGVKFSVSYKEARHSYCVAITLAPRLEGENSSCSTFWGETIGTAVAKAFISCAVFGAVYVGWGEAARLGIVAQSDLKSGDVSRLPRIPS